MLLPIEYYRESALISLNIVLSWGIEGHKLASVHRAITFLLYNCKYFVPFPVVCTCNLKNGFLYCESQIHHKRMTIFHAMSVDVQRHFKHRHAMSNVMASE